MYLSCFFILALVPTNGMGEILYTKIVVRELEKRPKSTNPPREISDLHMECERRSVIKNGHLPQWEYWVLGY